MYGKIEKCGDSTTSSWIESSYSISSFSQVLEEVVYNSIDAGAKKIDVQYDLDLLCAQISDDGHGIQSQDLNNYIGESRGVTSNATTVKTFGFRGQFLASLCAMAHVEITSKAKQEFETYKKVIKNGKVISCTKALFMRTTGTTLVLTNLFDTLPVRKEQILSKKHLEVAMIIRMIQAIAIIHPNVQITLTSGGNIQVQTHQHCQTREDIAAWKVTFAQVFGEQIAKFLTLMKRWETNEYKLYGYFCSQCGVLEKSFQFVYINGRWFEEKRVKTILKKLYQKVYFDKKKDILNPVYIFRIDTRVGYLDYAKLEDLVWQMFEVDKKESKSQIIEVFPTLSTDLPLVHKPITAKSTSSDSSLHLNDLLLDTLQKNQTFGSVASQKEIVITPQTSTVQVTVDGLCLRSLRVITQLDRRFILAASTTAIYAFDQHAVDERIRLEALMQDILSESQQPGLLVEKKRLDPQQTYPIHSAEQLVIITSKLETFNNWYWDIQVSSNNSIVMKSVPLVCGVVLSFEDFVEFVEELQSNPYKVYPKSVLRIASYKACRSAVKFGDILTNEQCQFMIDTLSECKNPFICAHGRPSLSVLGLLPQRN